MDKFWIVYNNGNGNVGRNKFMTLDEALQEANRRAQEGAPNNKFYVMEVVAMAHRPPSDVIIDMFPQVQHQINQIDEEELV